MHLTKEEITIKFLNFQTPEIFAVIYLKFKTKRKNLRVFHQKDANGIANSEDPDQTAPLGSGSSLFAQVCMSQNLVSLRYHGFVDRLDNSVLMASV